MHRVITVLIATTLWGASDSYAQPTAAQAKAEQLYNDARKLMTAGRYVEASRKLQESQKLDPANGTLFNLAYCYEKIGKLASAGKLYRLVVIREAQRGKGKGARAAKARQFADALEPKIPRLTIVIPESSKLPDLAVERNGQAVDEQLQGVADKLDTGEYQIVAKAPGHQTFTKTVSLASGDSVTVKIPKLLPEAPTKQEKPRGEITETVLPHTNTRRIVGLTTGGVGVVLLGAGLGLGFAARSSWNEPFDDGLCNRDTLVCNAEGQIMTDDAIGKAKFATFLLGVGAAAVATGVVLYLTAPRSREKSLTIAPLAGSNSFGVSISGGF